MASEVVFPTGQLAMLAVPLVGGNTVTSIFISVLCPVPLGKYKKAKDNAVH